MVPKVTAWQCPHTGNLFVSEEKYRAHLARLARDRRDQRRWQKIADERAERLTAFRAGLTDIRNIEAYVLEHQRLLWDAARTNTSGLDRWQWEKIPVDWYPIVERIVFNVRYSDSVSNSHRCPIDGVTNWGGRTAGAPRGYPGYTGSVEWWTRLPKDTRIKKIDPHIAGSLFSDRLVAINTGTGGGGGVGLNGLISYRYGVEIFLADWDRLKKTDFLKRLAGSLESVG